MNLVEFPVLRRDLDEETCLRLHCTSFRLKIPRMNR
jgi:hypothetical protein